MNSHTQSPEQYDCSVRKPVRRRHSISSFMHSPVEVALRCMTMILCLHCLVIAPAQLNPEHFVALRKYIQFNNSLMPQRIIIYRDGVGEGQLPCVYRHEVKLILEKLNVFYVQAQAVPKVVFVKLYKHKDLSAEE